MPLPLAMEDTVYAEQEKQQDAIKTFAVEMQDVINYVLKVLLNPQWDNASNVVWFMNNLTQDTLFVDSDKIDMIVGSVITILHTRQKVHDATHSDSAICQKPATALIAAASCLVQKINVNGKNKRSFGC